MGKICSERGFFISDLDAPQPTFASMFLGDSLTYSRLITTFLNGFSTSGSVGDLKQGLDYNLGRVQSGVYVCNFPTLT